MRSMPPGWLSKLGQRLLRAFVVLLAVASALWPGGAWAGWERPHAEPPASAARTPLPRVQCPAGYTARIYAQGLSSPDGLALSPGGMLYVAEETSGEVSRIEANGSATPIASGLVSPEGIAFDNAGNLYVVEDAQAGRLLKVAPGGAVTTLASGFDAPEGVVWTPDGTLYVTESNVQFASIPPDFPQTRITAVSPTGVKTPVVTHNPSSWSYAGITWGADGLLYVTNEASGMTNPGTHDGIFSVNPATQERKLLASHLRAPEGLRFAAGGGFPLYVAQEDTWDEPPAAANNYQGVVSRIEANGSHVPFCTGFESIEDVIQDDQGHLYVSEDSTGLVIVIGPEPPQRTRAGAIILFIGDGMGEAQRRAGRWSGIGRSGALSMDRMPTIGWSRTASADNPVTDSAAAATALASGVKTNNGRIGQDPAGNPVTTILERAQARGMAVGLVTTVQMAHATPAAFAAHVPDRNMMTEIARQLLAADVDVLLGGGEDEFLPTGVNGCYSQPGERADGRNLIAEAQAAGYTYICNAASFSAVPTSTTRLLGLFADEEMVYPFSPPLADMTQKAIGILSQDPDGFFLMVEGGQIDLAGHANDATRVISDTLGFDQAMAAARAYAASAGNTLIIVTGDHETGGMSAALTSSGLPNQDGPFAMPDGTPFYVNWTTGEHTAADVPTTAQGPWSDLLVGNHENTYIHDVMRAALDGSPTIARLKVASPGHGSPVVPGSVITYSITLTNYGEADADGLVLTDTLPTHTTFVPGSASASGTAQESNGRLTFSGNLPGMGGVFSATFAVTVTTPLTDAISIVNVADFAIPGAGISGQTNPVTHTVVSTPLLALAKSSDPAPGSTVQAGDWITYTLTATNTGTGNATGVVISDTLDSSLRFVDVVPAAGVTGPNPLVFTVGTLPGGGAVLSYTVRVTVTHVASGTHLTNAATLTSHETGLQASNLISHTVQSPGGEIGTGSIYLPIVLKGARGL